jgi:DNA-binding response OmpR family regulator
MLTAHILLVEDEEITAALTESVLREQFSQVSIAADGESAWKMLKSGTVFDAVLLDRGLPDIDGIVLLQRIKADPELSWVPVIMVTSRDDSESIRETFAAGANYYLTKPLQASYLLAVPRLAIKAGHELREIETSRDQAWSCIGLLDSGTFRYSTLAQAQKLAMGLAQVCPDPARALLGIHELLINAVEHGNLGISYEQKSLLMLEDHLRQEIERRLQDPAYSQLQVSVHLVRDADGVSLTIQDQGQGFAWQDYLEFSPERAFDMHGRGIAMAATSFDIIEYRGNGNYVHVTINSSPSAKLTKG